MSNTAWLRSNWLLLAIIAFGLFLRLVWVNDMEWKDDEKYMFNTTQEVAKTGHWHGVGMESGGGIVNPGLGMGIFSALSYLIHTPTGMASAVQWINVISILCFLLFITIKIEKDQRDIWLWGLALAAVSPLAVLFSRKIWAQDMLPFFCFVIIWSNANRNKGWGAFLWGLFGALVGQIHMSGFFYAAGLFIFTVVYDYRNKQPFKWVYWILGSLIGSIGLIPWVIYNFSYPQPTTLTWDHALEFNSYICWFLDSHGLNTMYTLGRNFWDFIKYPYIGTHATYLVAALNVVLAGAGIYTLVRVFGYVKSIVMWIKQKQFFDKLTLNLNSTDFYILSLILGLGILLNFSGALIFAHYLIAAFPFTYILMAKIFQSNKKLLMGIILAQLLLTTLFLGYIHKNSGAPDGDYGVTYRAQIEAK